MKVLVTGAGGFVGTEVVKNLLSHGFEVRGLIRNPAQREGLEKLGAEVFIGDLKDKASIKKAVTGVKRIFHIAALFRQAGLPDSEYYDVNLEGTRNMLDAGVEEGIEKFIHCSTVGVHGDIKNPPCVEDTPFAPGDHYQISKLQGENLVNEYFKNKKLSGAIIRPAMIYGKCDTRLLKLFKMISQNKFFYVGPGDALVHFIDVRDLADAFRLAAEVEEANGETFIISGRTSLKLRELVTIVSTLFGVAEPKLHLPVKPMQILGSICETICTPLKINPPIFRRRVDFFTKNRNFDSAKARRILGFKPQKSLVEELIDIIDSYLESGMIQPTGNNKPASILRTIDGQVKSLDNEAKKLYGLDEDKLIGKLTHDVFQTEFPEKLDVINKTLKTTGKWKGKLLHKTKANKSQAVDSKWMIVPNGEMQNQMILEVNTPSK